MIFKKIIEWLINKYNTVFFIGNAENLPAPLSKNEELKYLIEFKQGDIDARNVLIEHNLRLVVFLAKKYTSTGYDLEDLVSIGTIGLIKGITTYKIDKNIRLATYASRCITNEILMYIRKNKNRKGEISFEDALNYDGVSVIIAKYPCNLINKQKIRERKYNIVVDNEKCVHCNICVDKLACPSINEIDGKITIDQVCNKCGVCTQVCPTGAISKKE